MKLNDLEAKSPLSGSYNVMNARNWVGFVVWGVMLAIIMALVAVVTKGGRSFLSRILPSVFSPPAASGAAESGPRIVL